MIKFIVIFITFTLTSCASKFPMQIDMTEYVKGLEATENINQIALIDKQNFCIEIKSDLMKIQPLPNAFDQEVLYLYEPISLFDAFKSEQACATEDLIMIDEADFSWDVNNTARLHRYDVNLKINALSWCNQKQKTFSSIQKRRLIKKGFHGHEVSKAVIAAAMYLVFYDALSDIKNQMASECLN